MKLNTLAAIILSASFAAATAQADVMSTSADYAFILDADTETPLFSKNGDEAMVPASMTKIMTAYMVFDRIREGRLSLEDAFKVSENAWRKGGASSGGSTMFLEVGSTVSVEDLLRGVIIQSGNDACIVLAEGISGSEEAFAAEMTERAREMGMDSVTFKNATGLYEEGHQISPRDLAQIALKTIREFPEYYHLYGETGFTWNGISQPNRNPLLDEVQGADGLKTGHLDISGYGLVGTAVREGQRRIIVLNGMESKAERASEARRVMRAAFTDFRSYTLADSGAIVGEAEVFQGTSDKVPLTVNDTVKSMMHVDQARRMNISVEYNAPIHAPVVKGQIIGELVATSPGSEDIRVPLVAAEDVARMTFIERALMGLGLGG